MPKQNSPTTGIILDQPYSNGLLAKAVQSGHAKILFDSGYTRDILAKARNPMVGQKALEMLLLYDKAYISDWFDNVDLEPLIKEGLLEQAPNTSISRRLDPEHALSIKALLLADLRRRKVRITPNQFDGLLPEANDMSLGSTVALAERIWPEVARMLGINPDEGEKAVDIPSLSERLGFSKELQIAQKRTPEEIELAEQIRRSYYHMSNLMYASDQLNASVLTNITRVPKVKINQDSQAFNADTQIAVAIYFNEALLIPRIQTVEDVIRLREDHNIRYFREKIFSWSEKLRTGEFSSEDAIRREIREANEAMKKLEKWKTISMWTTYISVGLDVLGFLLRLPLTLVSTTPLGLGLEVANKWKERRYRWLLLGR
jgi:hypothetical protein